MKDSGIDWIGKIPDEWEIYQLSQVVTQVKNKNTNLQEKNLLSLSYGKIKRKNIDSNDGLLPASFDGYNIIENGDIVLRLTDLQNDHTSLRVGRATEKGIITSAYTTLRPMNKDNSRFLYYLLHAFDLKKGFYGMGAGVRQGLNYSEVKSLKIILPNDKSEQTKIANFLDKKCAQIDSIIEESKKSIEEYKSWKQSVIFEAVTGKNLSCKKKDSGIEWLGEIPENFIITRIKHIATLAGRIGWQGLTSQEYSDEGCYLITGINFSNGEINWESCVRVPYSRWEEASQIQIENGDLLITKDGTVGKVAIVNNMPDKTSLNSGVLLIRQNKKICSTRFLFWILQSNVFWKWFNYINAGNSTIIHLYQHDFSNFSFPNPSIEIQNEISNYLDKKCTQIDSLISEKQSLIKDLAEYKKSLIFEAVTGKRRV